ncbi:MAG: hypothetical protein ACRCXZ_10070 [Patescibacteria group bacterium]
MRTKLNPVQSKFKKKHLDPTPKKYRTRKAKLNKIRVLNTALAVLLLGASIKLIIPDASLNPIDVISKSTESGSNELEIGFNVSNKSSVNPKQLQDKMKAIPGAVIVTDVQGNLIAAKGENEPMDIASVHKILTAHAFLLKYDPNQKLANYGNTKAYDVAEYMLASSDNGTAEKMAADYGYDKLQQLARDITGDQNLVITNGSGINGGCRGSGLHGQENCNFQELKVSAGQMVKIIRSFDSDLNKKGFDGRKMLGGNIQTSDHNFAGRYGGYFTNRKTTTLFGKTGTLNRAIDGNTPIRSAGGIAINQSGEKLYFTIISPVKEGYSIGGVLNTHGSLFNEMVYGGS